jgi:hypothetical protein
MTRRAKNVTNDPWTLNRNEIEPFNSRIAGPGFLNDRDLFTPVSAASAEGLPHDVDDQLAISHLGSPH